MRRLARRTRTCARCAFLAATANIVVTPQRYTAALDDDGRTTSWNEFSESFLWLSTRLISGVGETKQKTQSRSHLASSFQQVNRKESSYTPSGTQVKFVRSCDNDKGGDDDDDDVAEEEFKHDTDMRYRVDDVVVVPSSFIPVVVW